MKTENNGKAKYESLSKGLGITGLVLGIVALLVSFIPCFGLFAVFFGIIAISISLIGLVIALKHNHEKGLIIGALICSLLGCGIAYSQYVAINSMSNELIKETNQIIEENNINEINKIEASNVIIKQKFIEEAKKDFNYFLDKREKNSSKKVYSREFRIINKTKKDETIYGSKERRKSAGSEKAYELTFEIEGDWSPNSSKETLEILYKVSDNDIILSKEIYIWDMLHSTIPIEYEKSNKKKVIIEEIIEIEEKNYKNENNLEHNEYKGKIESYPITMKIKFYGEYNCNDKGSLIEGYYFYDKNGESNKLILQGHSCGKNITIEEKDINNRTTGVFNGIKNNDKIEGVWRDPETNKKLDFSISKEDFKKTKRNESRGEYVKASERILKASDISSLSKSQLKIMRNEIFARYGHTFKSGGEMEAYFNKQEWYKKSIDDATPLLSEIEKENINFIKKYEGKNISSFIISVDNLRVRTSPNLDADKIENLPLNSIVVFLDNKSDTKTKVTIKGEEINEYWYQIKTPSGSIGWIHGCCFEKQ